MVSSAMRRVLSPTRRAAEMSEVRTPFLHSARRTGSASLHAVLSAESSALPPAANSASSTASAPRTPPACAPAAARSSSGRTEKISFI